MKNVEELAFSRDWTNADDFPAIELEEAKVRADMQCLYNEIRDFLNTVLLPNLVAANIPFSPVPGISGAGDIQSAVEAVQRQVAEMAVGVIPDNSLTTEKYGVRSITDGIVAVNDALAEDFELPEMATLRDVLNKIRDLLTLLEQRKAVEMGGAPMFAPVVEVKDSREVTAQDLGAFLHVQGEVTLTVPDSEELPLGAEFEVFRGGASEVRIAGGGNVTFAKAGNSAPVAAVQTVAEQYASVVLKKIDTAVWSIQGAVG
ncbi:MAG: hypothetical protein PUB51_00575 [Oscillospiraceae bacterium]|nr:hypothetical protein [Oscillospiraceae bacterium]